MNTVLNLGYYSPNFYEYRYDDAVLKIVHCEPNDTIYPTPNLNAPQRREDKFRALGAEGCQWAEPLDPREMGKGCYNYVNGPNPPPANLNAPQRREDKFRALGAEGCQWAEPLDPREMGKGIYKWDPN